MFEDRVRHSLLNLTSKFIRKSLMYNRARTVPPVSSKFQLSETLQGRWPHWHTQNGELVLYFAMLERERGRN